MYIKIFKFKLVLVKKKLYIKVQVFGNKQVRKKMYIKKLITLQDTWEFKTLSCFVIYCNKKVLPTARTGIKQAVDIDPYTSVKPCMVRDVGDL